MPSVLDNETYTLIFDVGKTHIKLSLLDNSGKTKLFRRTANKSISQNGCEYIDVDMIWDWFVSTTKDFTRDHKIESVNIATHGAAAAFVDRSSNKLQLPLLDYEFDDYPAELEDRYKSIRPDFSETASPLLTGGLNLGKQICFQLDQLSAEQISNSYLLLYPQYWAWKLTGVYASEVTSLGCHTDLWNVKTGTPTSLLKDLGAQNLLPPLVSAIKPLGRIHDLVSAATGLPANCKVWPGLHDSNAGYVPYLKIPPEKRPTVISTGTWSIVLSSNTPIEFLDEKRDMLMNIDALGNNLATARFMGGREFSTICMETNTDIATTFTKNEIIEILDKKTMAWPTFAKGSGPYRELEGQVTQTNVNGKALATVYCALMLDDILNHMHGNTPHSIVIEGSFAANEVLCSIIAELNTNRATFTPTSSSNVVDGCYMLTVWDEHTPKIEGSPVSPLGLPGLKEYASTWKTGIQARKIATNQKQKDSSYA